MLLTAIRKEKYELRKEGEIIGIQIGEVIGIQIGVKKTAKNLLKMGLSFEQISEATGLSIEEIEELRA
jgi:predicted transposase/invertase (TIGR01784 family)